MERYKLYFRHIIPPFFILLLLIIYLIIHSNQTYFIYSYSTYFDGYVIEEYHGNEKRIEIPKTYNGKNVVEIGVRAFYENNDIEEVILNPNIKSIERLAFSNCNNLKSIDLSNVEYIGRNAFSYCKSLDNIKIKAMNILGSTFYKCEELKNIELLDGVKSIGSLCFSYTRIEELRLPQTFVKIYEDGLLYSNIKTIYTYKEIDSIEGVKIIKIIE